MNAKTAATVFGVVFVVVALLGFAGGFGIVGMNGFFETNPLHDIVHLLSGIIFLIVAFAAPSKSSATLMIFGVVYALVTILGFAIDLGALGLAANSADNYLHLVLAIAIFYSGYSTKDSMAMM